MKTKSFTAEGDIPEPLDERNAESGKNMPSNEDLLRKLQADERPYEAFSQLVTNNSRRFYAIAYRILGNKPDAEDVVQECFLRIWHRSELWDATKGAKFTTWFSRVILNECRMHMRKSTRNAAKPGAHNDYEEDEKIHAYIQSGEGTAIENEFDDAERSALVKKAVTELPDRQKEALILCFYEECTNKEAAEIMDVGIKALESLLMRAKKQLKEMLHGAY